MNTPEQNRRRVIGGLASVTTGMRKIDLDVTQNRYVCGNDKYPELWPCRRDHPPYRVKPDSKSGRLYCRECQAEKAVLARAKAKAKA